MQEKSILRLCKIYCGMFSRAKKKKKEAEKGRDQGDTVGKKCKQLREKEIKGAGYVYDRYLSSYALYLIRTSCQPFHLVKLNV